MLQYNTLRTYAVVGFLVRRSLPENSFSLRQRLQRRRCRSEKKDSWRATIPPNLPADR